MPQGIVKEVFRKRIQNFLHDPKYDTDAPITENLKAFYSLLKEKFNRL